MMRTKKLTIDDLNVATGSVVRLADVVAPDSKKSAASASGPGSNQATAPVKPVEKVESVSAPRPPERGDCADAASSVTGSVLVRDAVLQSNDGLETRVARLVRAAAWALRPFAAGEPVDTTVTVLASDPDPDQGSARSIFISDVGSLEVSALARQISGPTGTASPTPGKSPRLSVVDATQLDVRRIQPHTQSDITVAVARPVDRVVPATTTDGTAVIAVRQVSEITVVHTSSVAPALAAQVAIASANAFAAEATR